MRWRAGCCGEHDPEKACPHLVRVGYRFADQSMLASKAAYIFTPGILPSIAIMPPPRMAPMMPKMIEMMITAGIDANAHLMMIATMRQNGMSISAIATRCGAAGG